MNGSIPTVLLLGASLLAPLSACDRAASVGANNANTPASLEALCLEARDEGQGAQTRTLSEMRSKVRAAVGEASAWVALGQALVRGAREQVRPELYRNADACARTALVRDPGHAGALQLRAMVLLNEHRFAEARDAMRALLARHPDDAVAWELRSDAELELGEVDAAIESAQHMMDLKPNLPAYGRAAHLRWLQGDERAAKQLYAQAIAAGQAQSDPEPRAWMIAQAALVFWHAGDYAGADAGFDLALRQLADYPPALEGKGRVALARGDYRAAVEWLRKAEARTGLLETSWLLGDAQLLLGERDPAEAAYARVTSAGRRHDPRTLAAFLATKNRDSGLAVELARAELKQRADVYTKDVLAWALYRRGELSEARRLSEQSVALGTPDARLLYHAGVIALAAGDAERGRVQIQRALALNPHFDRVLLAQDGRDGHVARN